MTEHRAPDIVGLGYCSWDYLGILDHIPDFDAPTESMFDFAISGGGPVSTALVTLARLGARSGYIGVLGDDEPGRSALRAFQDEGIDTTRLRVEAGARSAVCFCLVQAGTAKRVILCYRGTTPEVELDDADRRYLTGARFLHLDGHHLAAAIDAARWMRDAGGTVVLDANRPRPGLEHLLPWVDVLITNSHFPVAYCANSDLEQAMGELLGGNTSLVVTTVGAEGCLCRTRQNSWKVPGLAVEAVDTTGAGDAFHGAFLYGLSQGWSVERTALFANATAALNCRALGGRGALPRRSEVEALLQAQGRTAP
jgi:ribokinase